MKYIDINQVLEVENCKESLKKWLKNFKVNETNNLDQQVEIFLDKYLKTVKPVIENFTSLTQSLDQKEYGFFSKNLSKNQVITLQELFDPLQKFTILSKQFLEKNIGNEILNDEDVQKLIKKSEPIYKMDLQHPPINKEYKYWGHTIPIKAFIIEGVVEKGKGLGKEGLGMPTANTKISSELNKTLESYPNGIYITTVTFKNKHSQIYIGASSLGTNPHYENTSSNRILETYIINDFKDENFYGETILTEFHSFIRPEFKFKDFSAFLHGMRNDIEVAKESGKNLKFREQIFCS